LTAFSSRHLAGLFHPTGTHGVLSPIGQRVQRVRARRLASHRLHSVWTSKLARAVCSARPHCTRARLAKGSCFQLLSPRNTAGLSPKDVHSDCGSRPPAAPASPPSTPNTEALEHHAGKRPEANTSASRSPTTKREPPARNATQLDRRRTAEAIATSASLACFPVAPRRTEKRSKSIAHAPRHLRFSQHHPRQPKLPWGVGIARPSSTPQQATV